MLRRGAGRYDVLLVLVVAVLVIAPFQQVPLRQVHVLFLIAVFLYAMWTSGATRSVMIAAGCLGALTLGASAVSEAAGGDAALVVFAIDVTALCLTTIAALLIRLIPRRRVSHRILAAAVAVYVLFGLLFASVFFLVGVGHSTGFFAQSGPHDAVSYLYFSFITLTSVGYGDLTPRGDAGRMLSGIEAPLGQLYLVTVIAVVVTNRSRLPRGHQVEEDQQDSAAGG